MPKNITFVVEEKTYKLEYTAETVCLMEQAGSIKEFIESVEDHPISAAFTLLEGAFLAHHGDLTGDEIHDIVAHLGNKEKLFQCLVVMFNEALQGMFGESGKAAWTFSEAFPTINTTKSKS